MSLEPRELEELRSRIGRDPTPTELRMVAAQWSEHCSYKSSKIHLGMLPMEGSMVIDEKGYDSGVLDVGDGYVVTAHIESHNHPSAVEPYGGAATGVGGVIRDILSSGTRPIAILDGLRFGDIRNDPHARWLVRNVVRGIADYGNCIGVPTVGGEMGFDGSYAGYALVDVAAVGFGRRDALIRNRARRGDVLVLLGGSTGRDGIGGAQFASDSLESEDRSAVQIPDPFMEKLMMEAVLEARRAGLIHAMKDLGGGGLSCAVSETADTLGIGVDMDVAAVHAKESGMSPAEIMTSESQERMLVVTTRGKLDRLKRICARFRLACSVIGAVESGGMIRVRRGDRTHADLPAEVIANATLLDLPSKRPSYLDGIENEKGLGRAPGLSRSLLMLLGSPNIASREWVYGQYDHEVGIRTVVKPGHDASMLRLDNGRMLSVTMDGNPRHCHVNPREGAIGCFEEACRNVACTGARPIGMLDHLQFGSPGDPGVFWTFLESVRGLADLARHHGIPCVGGKVSLYNETASGPIKPTPVICVLGITGKRPYLPRGIMPGDMLVVAGETRDEMGGSEYFEHVRGYTGGRCPVVRPADSDRNMKGVLDAFRRRLPRTVHDCSNGGLAVAVAEMCMTDGVGCTVDTGRIPGGRLAADRMLFSESHSRYLMAVGPEKADRLEDLLEARGIPHARAGCFSGDTMRFTKGGRTIMNVSVEEAARTWSDSLRETVLNG